MWTAGLEGVKHLRTLWIGKWWTVGFVDSERGLSVLGTRSLFEGKLPLFWHAELCWAELSFLWGLEELRYEERSASGMFLSNYCCLLAGCDEKDCKEGPVWKGLCQLQEVWTKFLGYVSMSVFLYCQCLYFVLAYVTLSLLYLPRQMVGRAPRVTDLRQQVWKVWM